MREKEKGNVGRIREKEMQSEKTDRKTKMHKQRKRKRV